MSRLERLLFTTTPPAFRHPYFWSPFMSQPSRCSNTKLIRWKSQRSQHQKMKLQPPLNHNQPWQSTNHHQMAPSSNPNHKLIPKSAYANASNTSHSPGSSAQ